MTDAPPVEQHGIRDEIAHLIDPDDPRPPSHQPAYAREYHRRNKEHINALRRQRYAQMPYEKKLERNRRFSRQDDAQRPINKLKAEIGHCQRCGYDRCLAALDWHHPLGDGGGRDRRDLRRMGWDRAREFAAQCELICANCHREEHFYNGNRNNDSEHQ